MNSTQIKKWLKETTLILKWYLKNRPVPPPQILKQKLIRKYARKNKIDTLVETGTFLGDTVNELKNDFKQIYTIELNQELYEKASARFKDQLNIKTLHGDSGQVIALVLPQIKNRIIFWLDGHYSGGITTKGDLNTPIYKELDSIFNHPVKNHIILIDDVRLFIGQNDYPTLKDLQKHTANHGYSKFRVLNDIIIIER